MSTTLRTREPRGWLFWSTMVVGWAVMLFGVRGIVDAGAATNPPLLLRWVVGGALVHDLVLAPIATVIAVVAWHKVPRWWGGPVTVALALSVIVAAFTYPLVRGFGRHEANASTLPHDYGTNVALVVGAIWVVTAVVVVLRRWQR